MDILATERDIFLDKNSDPRTSDSWLNSMPFDMNSLYAYLYVLTVQMPAGFYTAYGLLGKDCVILFCGASFGCPNSSDVAAKYVLISGEETFTALQTLRVSPILASYVERPF
jgi:hypothetical protein